MDNFSVWSMLFVSFPEELFIVLITLAAAGYRDVLDFRNRDKVLKLLISSTLMTLSAIIVGLFFSPSLKLVLNTILFFVIIVSVYRYKPVYCVFGFLLSLIVTIGSEIIFVPLLMGLFDVTYQQVNNSTLASVFFYMPDRIAQIVTLILICKAKKLSLKTEKLLPADISIIGMYFLTLISNVLFIEDRFTISKTLSMVSKIKLTISISIGIIFSLWILAYLLKLRLKIHLKENIHDVELHHVKQLISEGKVDYAIQLIDSTLAERGYYNK